MDDDKPTPSNVVMGVFVLGFVGIAAGLLFLIFLLLRWVVGTVL